MNINQQIAIVQVYIHNLKDVEVNINVRTPKDFILLSRAYNVAHRWMQENNVKIIY